MIRTTVYRLFIYGEHPSATLPNPTPSPPGPCPRSPLSPLDPLSPPPCPRPPFPWTPPLQAIQVTFIVSCIYTGLGLLRMGWITKFLSHAVIGGFTTGAAITIGMGQVSFTAGRISEWSRTALHNPAPCPIPIHLLSLPADPSPGAFNNGYQHNAQGC